jgi:branched-chain amino acid transport system permease protein
MTTQARSVAAATIVVLALAAAPLIVPSFLAFQFAYAGAYAIAVLGLTVLTGASGQISLGHGAFMAIGGYTVAVLLRAANIPFVAVLPAAALLAGVAGTLVGLVALRLRGAFLALATFALAVSVPPFVKRFAAITGGSQGITLTAVADTKLLYFETWITAAVLFALTAWLLRGRIGRSLRALRDHEIAAVAFGIDPLKYKTTAFALSAAYAGIGGAFVALATSFVSPDTFSLQLSLALLVGLVLGGIDTLWGALVGGFIVEFLPLFAQSLNPAASALIYGIALILVTILMPGGVAGTLLTRRR